MSDLARCRTFLLCRPLAAAVPPENPRSSCPGTMWSWWRLGASQYGVRQASSLARMNRRNPAGKSRARESMPTRSPLLGGCRAAAARC